MDQQIFFIKIIWAVRIVTVTKTPHRNIIHEPCLPLQGIDDPAEQTEIPRSAAVTEYQSAGPILHTGKAQGLEGMMDRAVNALLPYGSHTPFSSTQ